MPILTFPREPWPDLPPLPPEDVASGSADQTGVWGCSPWIATSGPYSTDEFMLILSGEIALHAHGASQTVRAGDTFLITEGTMVDWHSTVDVRKVYCSILPAGTA